MSSSAAPLLALQQRLGHRFSKPELLSRALTHRSFSSDHNERLEFLGDAVLSLAVSSLLYERYAGSDEGDLTRIRAHLVREDSLHRLALDLGLPQVLRLSDGEAKGGGAQRPSILADALEAIIGATFIDAGYPAALEVVRKMLGDLLAGAATDRWAKDAKTALQEMLQARRLAVPTYRITDTRGQAHAQTFEVECVVPALKLATRGEGRSRRIAEQEAARRLLDELNALDKPSSGLRDKERPRADTP
ncbi:ribonuclease III [Kinneretia aquatilis]|uniref:ribonuclease III n=1 Tax=Kinneretia aquatilis TaxID=2070761 RepID=UPI0014952A17|nr:ribonuclease III [Paucibacter aquatile]WIV96653.1 ribonuclease III [Paucibacter aquatile]